MDSTDHRLDSVRPVIAQTVDEERRRAVDAAAYAAEEVLAHDGLVNALREFFHESHDVQTDDHRILHKTLSVERVLSLIELIVHGPEPLLGSGGLCGLGR